MWIFGCPAYHPLKVLQYGESAYVQEFGMTVEEAPLRTQARVINAPTLRYHQSSKQPSAVCFLLPSPEDIVLKFVLETAGWCMESVGLVAMVAT